MLDEDLLELFALFRSNNVEFLVVSVARLRFRFARPVTGRFRGG